MGRHCKHKHRDVDSSDDESECHKCKCDNCKNMIIVKCKGEKGDEGKAGKDGTDGKDGNTGLPGSCPTITACDDPCNVLEITQTDCNVCIKLKCPVNGDCHCKSQGYWKNHPEEWTNDNNNILCGCGWLDILLMNCGDDQPTQWRNLARQYITMQLNTIHGCDTSSLTAEILEAKTLLELCLENAYTTLQKNRMSDLTNIFDSFITEKEANCNNNTCFCECIKNPVEKTNINTSIFLWSEQNQDSIINNLLESNFTPIVFEKKIIDDMGDLWTYDNYTIPTFNNLLTNQISGPNTLICGKSGYYSISYSVNINIGITLSNIAILLTNNDIQISGSMTYSQIINTNLNISKTIITYIKKNDQIKLLFLSDLPTYIGSKNIIPSWLKINNNDVIQSSASLSIIELI